jgi:fluoride exporter
LKQLVLIFVGGGFGSVTRFALGKWVNSLHQQSFPWGTLAVNTIACLIVGFIIGLADYKQIISPASRIFWTVGFCGGFSTFSTFSAETASLLQNGLPLSAALYIAASLLVCVAATYAGLFLSEYV